jgi:energy-coupling factor transporter ATP-binding protein EcfA2
VDAVRGVDVSIERGETVALLGPNGAGKSTTIDMLLGLLEPDAGARIAGERATGWNRQLRLTPLRAREYFRAKIVTSYVMAFCAIATLYVGGVALGARMPGDRWLSMTLLLLVGLVPFAALGVLFGHVLTVDSIGRALGGTTALLAFSAARGFRSQAAVSSQTWRRSCPPTGSCRRAARASG